MLKPSFAKHIERDGDNSKNLLICDKSRIKREMLVHSLIALLALGNLWQFEIKGDDSAKRTGE